MPVFRPSFSLFFIVVFLFRLIPSSSSGWRGSACNHNPEDLTLQFMYLTSSFQHSSRTRIKTDTVSNYIIYVLQVSLYKSAVVLRSDIYFYMMACVPRVSINSLFHGLMPDRGNTRGRSLFENIDRSQRFCITA